MVCEFHGVVSASAGETYLKTGTGKAVTSHDRYAGLVRCVVLTRLPSILRPDVRGATFELGSWFPYKEIINSVSFTVFGFTVGGDNPLAAQQPLLRFNHRIVWDLLQLISTSVIYCVEFCC